MKKGVDIFVDTPFLGPISMISFMNVCFPYIYTQKKSCAYIGGIEKNRDNSSILNSIISHQGGVYISVYNFSVNLKCADQSSTQEEE
jgi:hypothetical protein